MTDSLAETKLFSSNPKSTDDTLPTTNVEQSNGADSGFENAWETTEQEEKDKMERAKCPAHQKLCNPNLCPVIVPHCKSLGLDIRELKLKLGGPSNIYTLERGQLMRTFLRVQDMTNRIWTITEKRMAEENKQPRRGGWGRGRGDPRRRPNPASERW